MMGMPKLGSALLMVGVACGIRLPAPSSRVSAPAMQMQSWNPIQNLKQMADQRVAKISHCMLAAGTDMTLAQANAKMDAWKAEIGNDEAKFAEVAKRESECPTTAAAGGEVGVFPRGKMTTQLDELIFQEDVKPVEFGGTGGVVRGPIGTSFGGKAGLSLIYVHTCWEPKGMSSVGAMLDPPESLKNKMNNLFGGSKE